MEQTVRENNKTLYSPKFEHDNCGIGAVVNIKGIKSHDTVANALTIVETLEHRAGKDAEGKTGDGVGILLQISHKFFKKAAAEIGIKLGSERDYAVGMFFFPQNELARNQAKKMFEIIAEKEGLTVLGWRNVPSKPEVLGHRAVECMPAIMQCFIKRPHGVKRGLPFDRKLYVARRVFEQSNEDTYVVSLSSRTIVYKGMFLVGDLRNFFLDLQDDDYESAIAMVHSRFSTNTNPSWQRAHPNRMIVHNGEINTIRGNADKMLAREETMRSEHLKGDLDKVIPVVNTEGSDSAMLDNTLEFLVMSGMELPLAVMITIPEPWDNNGTMSQKKKDFYQYYATRWSRGTVLRQSFSLTVILWVRFLTVTVCVRQDITSRMTATSFFHRKSAHFLLIPQRLLQRKDFARAKCFLSIRFRADSLMTMNLKSIMRQNSLTANGSTVILFVLKTSKFLI